MGNTAQLNLPYNVPINNQDKKNDESSIYRAVGYENQLLTIGQNETVLSGYESIFKKYADNKFLGKRKKDNNGELLPEFEFITYSDVKSKVDIIGSNIMKKNLAPLIKEYKNFELRFVGLYSPNSINWYLTELASVTQNITTVPIYDTLGEEAVKFAFDQTNMTTLFLTAKHYINVVKNINNKNYHLENLVIMDSENFTEDMKKVEKKKVNVIMFEELLEPCELLPWADVKPNDIYTFSYTSGTTGEPKGAMISHKNMCSFLAGVGQMIKFDEGEVHISYLPLAHVMERVVFNRLFQLGGQIACFNGDKLKLVEDISILKPTLFVSVPRLFLKFYDKIKKQFDEATGFKKWLINYALNSKLKNLELTGEVKHSLFDKLIFSKVQDKFGGRIKNMLTGSAPISAEVLNFLKVVFSCNIIEAYGQTEGCGGEFATNNRETVAEHVGAIFPNLEFKLVDIPEMNYLHTDLDKDNKASPRGEIWVRGDSIIPGYYKNEDKTKESISEDGWLKSGDVGQILSYGNRLKVIDRKKNIFKLSQGEYIAPDKLESCYKKHPNIDDIYVYGDPLKAVLVAIVNIEKENFKILCEKSNIEYKEENLEELSKNEKIISLVSSFLKDTHKEKNLNSLERIAKFHIETRPFLDLDLVTSSFKLKRYNIKVYYKNVLDAMYKDLN